MKTITCIDCDMQFSGATPEETMKRMMPHYMEDHQAVMEAGNQEQKKIWIAEFQRRWDTAPAIES